MTEPTPNLYHFDTSSLPDGATIVAARLKLAATPRRRQPRREPSSTNWSTRMPPPRDLVKLLTDARAKIDTPDHWTKGSFARKGPDGIGIAPNDPNATCYCAFGAIMCVTSYDTPASIFDEMRKIATRLLAERDPAIEVDPGKDPVVFFNDHPTTTHEDVMLLFAQTIAVLTPRTPEVPTS